MEDRQEVNPWRIIPILHAAAAVGLGLYLIAVLLWAELRDTPLGPPLAWCFDVYCHNIPARSLYREGEPLPVCARCTGVIAGYLLAAVAAVCGAEKLFLWRLPWGAVFIGLMGMSWLGGYMRILDPHWHWERVVAGALGGAGGYILISRCVVLALRWWTRRQLPARNSSTRTCSSS